MLLCLLAPMLVGAAGAHPPGQDAAAAAAALLQRVAPAAAGAIVFEQIAADAGRDVLEIESRDGRVVVRGTNGVAMASGLNHYFKRYCRASFSLTGVQPVLPEPLPPVRDKVRIVTPFRYRYCFNYCCFSYSMAWWDWPQWERAIDWMAMQGVNMPLAVTGQEAVWQAACREMGVPEAALDQFFVGAAYLPFGWMGCMDGWGGPLSQNWIDRHRELQERILERERALGMTPVLQGFTGHVPAGMKEAFPDARYQQLPSWCGFPGTTFIDPGDPLFQRVGKAFIDAQTQLFGTDHLYAADTFIEMSPPSNEPAFLSTMAKAVYGGMAAADPQAVWVMQGWLFVNNPQFWRPPQAEALLTAIPRERMIVLDLFCESSPAWRLTNAFYGNPWVWCIIQNFGNQVSIHGGLPQIMANLREALDSPERGRLEGIGCIMEGLGYNPVVYDLMAELAWDPAARDLAQWVEQVAEHRYGRALPKAAEAWRGLLSSVYSVPGQSASLVSSRPSIAGHASRDRGGAAYHPLALAQCGEALLECADELGQVDAYQYDLVHVTRQVLLNLAPRRHAAVRRAYETGDREGLAIARARFAELLEDVDALLATRQEFLLGCWLEDAKRWATNDEERRLYEYNARNQITLWGPSDSVLHDYACKQWSGLIRGFYMPRWERFFDALDASIVSGQAFDAQAFEDEIQQWEEAWTHEDEVYASIPQGDPVTTARRLWDAYRDEILAVEAASLSTGKPATCSSSLPQHPASAANDGWRSDTDRYWATDVTGDPECWWQVDLEAPTQIGRVELVFYFGDDRSYGFTLDTSLDGEHWDRVADHRERLVHATPEGTSCRFPPRATRYVRVTLTHNSANTGRHLVEVMAYPE